MASTESSTATFTLRDNANRSALVAAFKQQFQSFESSLQFRSFLRFAAASLRVNHSQARERFQFEIRNL